MNSSVGVFGEWLARNGLGRRFYPIPAEIAAPFDDQMGRFNRRLDEVRPKLSAGRGIDVYADFIDDGRFNAVAGVVDGMGMVGIYKGAILLPFEMFYRMFSHPLVPQGLGQSQMERIGPQHSEGLTEDYDELVEARRRAGRQVLPRPPLDGTRQGVAMTCCDLVWGFIVWHELIHILHGHVEYAFAAKRMSVIREVSHAAWTAACQGDIDCQALELWADSKAVSIVLRGLLLKSDVPAFPRPQDKVFIWTFAMFTLFRIWGLAINPQALGGSHPPTAMRFEMAIHGGVADALAIWPEPSEDLWQAVYAGEAEAEKAIRYCGGEQLLPDRLIGTRDPRVKEHRHVLCEHLRMVLVPELRRYSHVPLEGDGY